MTQPCQEKFLVLYHSRADLLGYGQEFDAGGTL